MATLDEYDKALAAEWSTWVATAPIDVSGARAFNVGDPVPASAVDDGSVSSGSVARRTTKAAQAATSTEV